MPVAFDDDDVDDDDERATYEIVVERLLVEIK
jgi:hypothetical protein